MRAGTVASGFVVAAVVLAACVSSGRAPSQLQSRDDAIAAIMDFNRQSLRALNSGDVEALNALIADEYTIILPNRPVVRGKASIQAANRAFLQKWRDAEAWKPVETVVSGDWGFQRGTYEMTLTPREGSGPTRHLTGHYLHIYHRQADGSWKLARAMTN